MSFCWQGKTWNLSYSRVTHEEMCRSGEGILTSPWLSTSVLESYLVSERVDSLQLQVTRGKVLAAFCAYCTKQQLSLSGRLGVSGWRHGEVVNWGFHLLGDSDLNPSGVWFVDFCASHRLPITRAMFEHKGCS